MLPAFAYTVCLDVANFGGVSKRATESTQLFWVAIMLDLEATFGISLILIDWL